MNHMIRTCLVGFSAFLVLACLGADTNQLPTNSVTEKKDRAWGLATNGLQLSLEISQATFRAHEPIWANMVMRNVGRTAKEVSETAQIFDYRFSILNEQGRQAPLTLLGEKLKNEPESGWNSSRSLRPGDQMKAEHRLDRVWDMSEPGKYRITAIRPVSLDNWMELKARGIPLDKRFAYITSNTVEIEVVVREPDK